MTDATEADNNPLSQPRVIIPFEPEKWRGEIDDFGSPYQMVAQWSLSDRGPQILRAWRLSCLRGGVTIDRHNPRANRAR